MFVDYSTQYNHTLTARRGGTKIPHRYSYVSFTEGDEISSIEIYAAFNEQNMAFPDAYVTLHHFAIICTRLAK